MAQTKGTASKPSLTEGLTKRGAEDSDASMKCGKGSVNDNATRTSAASTPATLGPRTA